MDLKSVATIVLAVVMLVMALGNALFDWNYRYMRSINGYMRSLQRAGQPIDGPVARFTWRWATSALLAFFGIAALLMATRPALVSTD